MLLKYISCIHNEFIFIYLFIFLQSCAKYFENFKNFKYFVKIYEQTDFSTSFFPFPPIKQMSTSGSVSLVMIAHNTWFVYIFGHFGAQNT